MKLKLAPLCLVLVTSACGSSTKISAGDASVGDVRLPDLGVPVAADLSPSGPGCADGGIDLVHLPQCHRSSRSGTLVCDPAFTNSKLYFELVSLCDAQRIEYAVGTTPGGEDLRAFTALPAPATFLYAEGLNFTNGGTYYVTVRVTDSSGRATVTHSEPFMVDTTLAVVGTVNATATTTSMCGSWSGFSDPESGIDEFSYSIGVVAGAGDVKALTSVGLATSICVDSLMLKSGSAYYFTVCATNGSGYLSCTWSKQVYAP